MKRLLIFVPLFIVSALAGTGIAVDRLFINHNPPTYEVVIAGAEGIFIGLALAILFVVGYALYSEYSE